MLWRELNKWLQQVSFYKLKSGNKCTLKMLKALACNVIVGQYLQNYQPECSKWLFISQTQLNLVEKSP